MKHFLLSLSLVTCLSVIGQTTYQNVYNILQTNCASYCHGPGHSSGLDLTGNSTSVYNQLVGVDPTNTVSAGKGEKRVYAGDPYRSLLFRKINNGLAADVSLAAGEGNPMPDGQPGLDDKDIEMVRQWIIYGAKQGGNQVDPAVIADYYDNFGIPSMPAPPAAPAPGAGFQVHFGPYFLSPGEEEEYYFKYDTKLPTTEEVSRIDIFMGDFSHHFLIYRYLAPGASSQPYGLRSQPDHAYQDLVYGTQFSDSLLLPTGTAFSWGTNTVLDLNSHYINYSATNTTSNEVYVNVYTQPSGTAAQLMTTQIAPNLNIYIPNNSQEYTFSDEVFDSGAGEVFLWAVTTHTHQYGSDYDVYLRNANGTKGTHIFDASCGATDGVPGCGTEIYDYQHPPIRKWDSFLPVMGNEGFIHEASYINDGPSPVQFGLTSDDEMMVLGLFYLEDTTGLGAFGDTTFTALDEPAMNQIRVFPVPATDYVIFKMSNGLEAQTSLEVFDMVGRRVHLESIAPFQSEVVLNRNGLSEGVYFWRLKNGKGEIASGKMVFE